MESWSVSRQGGDLMEYHARIEEYLMRAQREVHARGHTLDPTLFRVLSNEIDTVVENWGR